MTKALKLTFLLSISSLIISLYGCYSSTAVTGIPVKDAVIAGDQRLIAKTYDRDNRKIIASMSESKGNRTFKEISGVPEYLLGPLDVLEINSYVGDKVTSQTVTVDNRGKISYSFIDDLSVNGLAPSELDRILTEKMSAYIKNPRIHILVKEFKSKSVTALGEISSLRSSTGSDAGSGRIYLEGKTTLMDLLALSGGYTVDADIKNIKLVRKGRTYRINLYDVLEKGDESQNVIVDDGDVIDIPELSVFRERIYVMGEVNNQGIYSLKDARDLLGAIALAGNVTRLAKEENTLIVRGYPPENGKPLVMMSDVKALLRKADLDQNIPLEEGDLVYVPRMRIGDINDWISNTMPLLDFLFYPRQFQDNYFNKNYLHLNNK
jgi:protein involved in polysaccharide export with SLBB domain